MSELELILAKLKLVSEEEVSGYYLCDKEHSKILLDEIERLNNIINGIDEILIEHINECREELNTIIKENGLDYINECFREFVVIRKNIEMIMKKVEELKGEI